MFLDGKDITESRPGDIVATVVETSYSRARETYGERWLYVAVVGGCDDWGAYCMKLADNELPIDVMTRCAVSGSKLHENDAVQVFNATDDAKKLYRR